MPDFTHLHVHSHYSLLDGLAKLPELLDQTKDLGMKSLALTDHGALYGLVEFSRLAEERGMHPILGLEAYLAPKGRKMRRPNVDNNPRHLTLLAQNFTGYKNLVKLSTASHLEGFYYKPRIDYELLTEYSEGIIVLSGCISGDIPKAILQNKADDAERLIKYHIDLLGKDRFYLELQDHPELPEQKIVNDALIRYAKKYDIRTVATCDVHYTHADDDEAQDVLLCVQTRSVVTEKDRMCMMGENFSLLSPDEMAKRFRDNPEAIENTARIADMCNVKLTTGKNILPSYPVPDGTTPESYLKTLCEKGLEKRYPISVHPASPDQEVSNDTLTEKKYSKEDIEKAHAQLEYELSIIEKTGFASYFLIVQDFVNWAKKQDILVGPGRGSAAGSIVSYLLNITDLDPIRYELMFERFLNPDRISMPDIDLDFADDRREEVIQYVKEKYGHDRVAQIVTFGTMAARAAIRDTGRALGLPYATCDTIAKLIPLQSNLEDAITTVPELKEQYKNDPQAKRLIDNAKRLEGVCRHASTHAAAVVVADRPLTEYVPLRLNDEAVVTQYAMNDIESLGLLKIDFLGLKNLTILQNALSRIREQYGTEINLQTLPLDDKDAFGILQRGDTTGVFQLESSGMKRYLKELKPTEFEDIVAMVSLYRPGPMDLIPEYIAGKHGRKTPSYLHPILKPILEKTYGIAIYQEQILQIARDLAGYTLGEADILRKAMGKKISSLLAKQKAKFISGAVSKGVDKKTAEKVFAFVEPFAGYGFNRCVTGDTLLHDPETGTQITIEELYKQPTKLRETFSLNPQGKIYRNTIMDVICNGEKPVFELTTKTGRHIRATANHPFLTPMGWTKLENISPKQSIAVPRTIPKPCVPQSVSQTFGLSYTPRFRRDSRHTCSYASGSRNRNRYSKEIQEVRIADQATSVDSSVSDVYWDEIVSIVPIGYEMTYDLTMDKDHNFIANGIFVHNSHAACYALIAYQTAYLKAHFPAAFMASLLTSDEGNSDRIAIEVAECETMGIAILPPDVNESDEDFTVVREEEHDRIRFGLRAIKNVGENCIRAILESRKKEDSFSDLSDFFSRVHSKDLNKKSVESLAKSGAFDSLGERNHILHNTETLLSFSRAIAAQQDSNQANLFGELPESDARPTVRLEETKPADKRQRLMWEKELLGLFVSGHPASDLSEHLGAITTPIAEITTRMTGEQTQIGGVVTQVQNIITRKGKSMSFITIEDRTKSIEVLIFSNVLEKVKSVIQEDRIVIVQGKVNDRDGVPKVIADTIREFDPDKPEAPPNTPSAVIFRVPGRARKRTFMDVKSVLESAPKGHTRVILEVAREHIHSDRIRTSYSITFTPAVKMSIQDILGPSAVRVEQSIASEAPIA